MHVNAFQAEIALQRYERGMPDPKIELLLAGIRNRRQVAEKNNFDEAISSCKSRLEDLRMEIEDLQDEIDQAA